MLSSTFASIILALFSTAAKEGAAPIRSFRDFSWHAAMQIGNDDLRLNEDSFLHDRGFERRPLYNALPHLFRQAAAPSQSRNVAAKSILKRRLRRLTYARPRSFCLLYYSIASHRPVVENEKVLHILYTWLSDGLFVSVLQCAVKTLRNR
jgi:hypothetical protein